MGYFSWLSYLGQAAAPQAADVPGLRLQIRVRVSLPRRSVERPVRVKALSTLRACPCFLRG